jgi:hypothetical protein
MKRTYLACQFLCLTTTFLFSQSSSVPPINRSTGIVPPISAGQVDPGAEAQILDSYGKLPLSFEANHGQTDPSVKFLSRTGGYTLFLTGDEAVLALSGKKTDTEAKTASRVHTLHSMASTKAGGVLRMKLRNANTTARVAGIDELPGTSNYFIGNDPAKWRTSVPTYAKVRYEGIYSGIDLVYYGSQRQLEYDFIVAPQADPHRIAFDVRGAKGIRTDVQGDLILKMSDGEIRWHKPNVYQEKDGARQEISAHYAITDKNRVGFELAKYDVSSPLYIDPLIYSTYLGGSNYESGSGVAVDSAGNAYVTGNTYSTDFPVTSGAFQTTRMGDDDVFVTKFNPTGSALVYSTYLGGSGYADGGGDIAAGIAVDGSGNAYVTGTTVSNDFPTTPGAFQTVCGGNCGDAFVTKINPIGTALAYSTYLGPGNGAGIAVDSAGNAYVTGFTESRDFPITPGAYRTTPAGAFVTKFNATGSALVYSTYLGGSGSAIGGDGASAVAVDSLGDAYVTGNATSPDFPVTSGAYQTTLRGGRDAFVTKLNPRGSGLLYSTFIGGDDEDWGNGIAIDKSDNAYVVGTAYSNDFPVTSGAFQTTCGGGGNNYSQCWDAFVSKVNASGSELVYSTYLGGDNDDWGYAIAVDKAGDAYVTGRTTGYFPLLHPLQTAYGNMFVTKFNPAGSALAYSTCLGVGGEQGNGIALDSSGNAYVTGSTPSQSFPTMGPLQTFLDGVTDAFVAKISAEPSDITFSLLHLNFTGQSMGIASDPQVSVLNNAGSDSLTITSIGITGANTGDFAQNNNCGSSVPAGGNCSINVTFTPSAIGNRSATVSIVDSDVAQAISLTGLGLLDSVTKLTTNVNPSAQGKPVTLKATVSSPSGGTPTGFVYFRDGATTTLAAKALSGGAASFTTTKLPLGLDVLSVIYQGDSNYGPGTSGQVNQNVLEASTTTTLMSSPNPSTYGQGVTFAAGVTSSKGGAPPDGETVLFMKGVTLLGTETLSGGSASFTTSALTAGTNPITAVYGGDSNLVGSKSKLVNQVVNKATTTTALVSSLNPSNSGQSVTFTATVTAEVSGAATGTVSFYDGSTLLKSVGLTKGAAKYTTKTLTSGKHTITATYNGSTDFTGSSDSLTQTVN